MAGSLAVAVIPSGQEEKLVTAIGEQWEVQYSRFFGYPPLASTSPALVPLPPYLRNRPPLGTWLTSSSAATLRLVFFHSSSGVVLTVSCGGKMQEEHYVSKLHASWPQVSCVSGFPARGTRAVIVSYRDSAAEIQICFVNFNTLRNRGIYKHFEGDSIIPAVVAWEAGILKSETETEPLSSGFGAAISSQSEFMSSNRTFCRAFQDSSFLTSAPVLDYTPKLPSISNNKAEKQMFIQETESIHKFESNFEAFKPSFTSLLTEYCPIDEQAADLTNCDDVHTKSQIAKFIEYSSFQDMLIKVEKAINEMGGDLAL